MNQSASSEELSAENNLLAQLLEAHGAPCQQYNGWLFPLGEAPGVLADWRDQSHGNSLVGSLAIVVQLLDRRQIVENFAGVGRGLEGIQDAFASFAICDLHVMLPALWNLPVPDFEEREYWHAEDSKIEVFAGPWHLRNGFEVPDDLWMKIRAAIERESLDKDLHWFRFFVGQLDGELTLEALKDSMEWPTGKTLLSAQQWPHRKGFSSARLFLIVRRTLIDAD